MVIRKFSILLCFIISTCVNAGANYEIELETQLSKCIKIESQKLFKQINTQFLKIKYKEISSTASCGCKSALSAYYVYEKINNYKSLLIGGKLLFRKNGVHNLPLAIGDNMIVDRSILIIFSCARPD